MAARFPQLRQGVSALGVTVAALAFVCSLPILPIHARPAQTMYDLNPRPVSLIPPGTVVGDTAPPGWTHLVIKSFPRAAAGDVDRLSDAMRDLSGKFFTCMLARVVKDKDRHRLAEVAVGLGAHVGGRDVILTAETQGRLGAGLPLLSQLALARGYARLAEVPSVVRSDTMIVVDGATTMVRGGRHRPVVLRYVNLCDPETGRLDTLLWTIDLDDRGRPLGAGGSIEWLPPNLNQERVLHVDAREFAFGLITESALAMTGLYRGRQQFAVADGFRTTAGSSRLTPESAAQMEATLRDLLRQAGR